jgi:hypothetical protein
MPSKHTPKETGMLDTLYWVAQTLDQYADAEGNGPGDYQPNWEMTLLNEVQEAIAKAEGE